MIISHWQHLRPPRPCQSSSRATSAPLPCLASLTCSRFGSLFHNQSPHCLAPSCTATSVSLQPQHRCDLTVRHSRRITPSIIVHLETTVNHHDHHVLHYHLVSSHSPRTSTSPWHSMASYHYRFTSFVTQANVVVPAKSHNCSIDNMVWTIQV